MQNALKILDLGCGRGKVKGAIGVDRVKLDSVDIVCDLTKFPYPFEDDSVDKVYCSHILEHFDVDTRSKAIEEIHRILKTGALLQIRAPHAFCISAFRDPTHRSFFTFGTMGYYTEDHPFSYYSQIRFKIIKKWTNIQLFNASKRLSRFKIFINNCLSEILNQLFKISEELPDLVVKIGPFREVEIMWVLIKE